MDYSESVYRSLGFAEPSELTHAVLEGAIPGLKKQKAFGDAASLQRACGREGGEGARRLPPLPPRMVPARSTAATGQPRCVVDNTWRLHLAYTVPLRAVLHSDQCTLRVVFPCALFLDTLPPSRRTVSRVGYLKSVKAARKAP
eukprot:scaffold23868_cov59-Phaeocystis_antarctica.AAC.2